MSFRAVVFDFYGTLAVSTDRATHRAGADRVAAALGVTADVYYDAVTSTFTERATGACGDVQETMRWLAARCCHTPTTSQLAAACALRHEIEAGYARALRPDAEPTLSKLKDAGIRLGLISDCTHELPEIWPSLPIAQYIDATVFSNEAGVRKPHPSLYATVARELGVSPTECIYVGDGGSGELTGAAAAGMTAYRLVTDDADTAVVYDADHTWSGATIHALTDLLTLVRPSGD